MKNLLILFTVVVFFAATMFSCEKPPQTEVESFDTQKTESPAIKLETNSTNLDRIRHYVHAKSGLRVRAEPNLKAEITSVLPYGTSVEVLQHISTSNTLQQGVQELGTDSTQIYVVKGGWKKVKFEKITGYIFDGYLAPWPVRLKNQNSYEFVDINFSDFSVISDEELMAHAVKNSTQSKSAAYLAEWDAHDPCHRFLLPMTVHEAYLIFILGEANMTDVDYGFSRINGRKTHVFQSGDFITSIIEYGEAVLLEEVDLNIGPPS